MLIKYLPASSKAFWHKLGNSRTGWIGDKSSNSAFTMDSSSMGHVTASSFKGPCLYDLSSREILKTRNSVTHRYTR